MCLTASMSENTRRDSRTHENFDIDWVSRKVSEQKESSNQRDLRLVFLQLLKYGENVSELIPARGVDSCCGSNNTVEIV
jgi:hypothetical protein